MDNELNGSRSCPMAGFTSPARDLKSSGYFKSTSERLRHNK